MSDKPRVLLVGGSGFIGTHMAKALLELGYDVTIYDNRLHLQLAEKVEQQNYWAALYEERADYLGEHWGVNLRYSFKGDSMVRTLRKGNFDYVIHMGDYSSQRMGGKYPEQIIRATVDNAAKLRESLPVVRKRTIYFSSSMVYGNFQTFAHEDQILNPIGHYGISRLAGETIMQGAAADNGADVVIVRPSAVFGPLDSDDRVIGQFALAALNNRDLRVNGPKMILDFTPVHVVVNKVIALMLAENLERRVFNVTMSDRSLRAMSLESAAATVVASMPGSTSQIKKYENESGWPTRGLLARAECEKATGPINFNPNLAESILGTCLWRKEFRERTGF